MVYKFLIFNDLDVFTVFENTGAAASTQVANIIIIELLIRLQILNYFIVLLKVLNCKCFIIYMPRVLHQPPLAPPRKNSAFEKDACAMQALN